MRNAELGAQNAEPGAEKAQLGLQELHVWTLALDIADPAREQRSAARAGLRLLLGSYLGIDPRAVELVRGAGGRPELARTHEHPEPVCARSLRFNLSHTAGLAVCAIGRGRSIGIDVEAVDRREPSPGVVERALNHREAERVLRADASERTAAFLHYWTVKEACAKALGVGLALDLREIGVAGPTDRPRLALPHGAGAGPTDRPRFDLPHGAGEWQVRRLWPQAGIVGAVVADGGPWRMRLRTLSLR